MAKSRFGDMEKLNAAVDGAALTAKKEPKKKEPTAKKSNMVYNIPVDLYEAINDTGESFSNFAKRAITRLAKEEGLY